MERHYNNLINSFLVHEGIRPACLLQYIDYSNKTDAENTLEKIKELYPELYHIPNYQGMIISNTNIVEDLNTHSKLGKVLGYPYHDEFDQILKENISGYVIEIIGYYKYNDLMYSTQIIVNRCVELNKLKQFKEIEEKANEYIGYKIEDIELIYFSLEYEKNYNTIDIIKYVYEYKELNPTILFHIGNIIYNMGIIDDNEIINTLFDYDKCFHRWIICMYLRMDLILTKYNLILPNCILKLLKYVLEILLQIF